MLRLSYNELCSERLSSDAGRRIVIDHPQLLRDILNDNLTKKQKCYIILYYRDGLSVTQIADRFGVNKSTVSRTITRGRKRIAELLKCELVKANIQRFYSFGAEDEDEGSANN